MIRPFARDLDRPRRDGQPGHDPRLAMVEPEPCRVEQRGHDRGVGGREAVDAAGLEPLDLVGREPGAAGGLLNGEALVQARRRQGRGVPGRMIERLDELHVPHSCSPS